MDTSEFALVHFKLAWENWGKFILYTFWKNAIITMLLFYYTFFSGYSGTCHFTALGSNNLMYSDISTTQFSRDVQVDISTTI